MATRLKSRRSRRARMHADDIASLALGTAAILVSIIIAAGYVYAHLGPSLRALGTF